MPRYLYVVILVSWAVWCTPFVIAQLRALKSTTQRATSDKRARLGIILQAIAYSVLWQGPFWNRHPSTPAVYLSVALFLCACGLSWSGATALGRQWRLDAGLNRDHQLVQSGPYRIVRHPIYASMLCLLLGTGILTVPWWLRLIALGLFLIGTEIRVRVEDRLLASHFGETAEAYQRRVPAYVPFVR